MADSQEKVKIAVMIEKPSLRIPNYELDSDLQLSTVKKYFAEFFEMFASEEKPDYSRGVERFRSQFVLKKSEGFL